MEKEEGEGMGRRKSCAYPHTRGSFQSRDLCLCALDINSSCARNVRRREYKNDRRED